MLWPTACVILCMQIPVPVNTIFTADYIEEMTQDHVLPDNVLTYSDLGIVPKKVTEGFPIEHIRYVGSSTETGVFPEMCIWGTLLKTLSVCLCHMLDTEY